MDNKAQEGRHIKKRPHAMVESTKQGLLWPRLQTQHHPCYPEEQEREGRKIHDSLWVPQLEGPPVPLSSATSTPEKPCKHWTADFIDFPTSSRKVLKQGLYNLAAILLNYYFNLFFQWKVHSFPNKTLY